MFDSGLGGLSVWRELVRLLPEVPVVYAADSGRCPYGSKSEEEIIQYSREITRFLKGQGCGLIVVACNTATAAAIRALRGEFDLPFVGMEPAIKPALTASRSGVVGILATEGTFRGRHFQQAQEKYAQGKKLLIQVGHGLVEMVEAGTLQGPVVEATLRRYLEPMLEAGADHIVLGCTHYPFLSPVMQQIVGDRAIVVDPAPAVARQASRLWQGFTTNPGGYYGHHLSWYTSGDPHQLSRFLGDMGHGPLLGEGPVVQTSFSMRRGKTSP